MPTHLDRAMLVGLAAVAHAMAKPPPCPKCGGNVTEHEAESPDGRTQYAGFRAMLNRTPRIVRGCSVCDWSEVRGEREDDE